jgi:hypothetical protein
MIDMAHKRKNSRTSKPARPVEPGQFSHDYRLQTISLREIVLALKRAALDIETYRDREGVEHVLTAGTLINALVLAFVELPPKQRREVALAAVARLEAFREALGHPGSGEADDCPAKDAAEAQGPSVGRPAPRSAGGATRRKSG